MKKVCLLLLGISLFLGCNQDDLYNIQTEETENNVLQGKTFVVNQEELKKKYAGNQSLNTILENDFKSDAGGVTTSSVEEGQYGVYIDLDHIQVFESAEVHAITYYVKLDEQPETEEPQEMYNLMYFSHDYETYYVTLFRYDFSQISFRDFVADPALTLNVLSFFPLNEIENIYENIRYSVSQGLVGTSSLGSNPSFSYELINLADCLTEITYPSEPCKRCGRDWGVAGCKNPDSSTRAKPPMTFLDFSDCYQTP